jgi:hypothetical protein
LFTVFDNVYTAVFFGLVWGFLIFNLDRFIVSTIKKRDHFLDEFIQASPRIVLAIIIAIVISKPLEIKIFQKEIETVLLKEKNEMSIANKNQVSNFFKNDVDKNKAEIDSLKSAITKKEKKSLRSTILILPKPKELLERKKWVKVLFIKKNAKHMT